MIKQDRELLCRMRLTNAGLADAVIELLNTMQDKHLSPAGLRVVADNLDHLVTDLRSRADQLDNTVDVIGDSPAEVATQPADRGDQS